jgi:hypothetical protein
MEAGGWSVNGTVETTALGLTSVDEYEVKLALSIYLQIAGFENLAGLSELDLPRMVTDLIQQRDSRVVARLGDVLGLAELAMLADGDRVALTAIKERVPHVSVLMTFETARALSGIWSAFQDAATT